MVNKSDIDLLRLSALSNSNVNVLIVLPIYMMFSIYIQHNQVIAPCQPSIGKKSASLYLENAPLYHCFGGSAGDGSSTHVHGLYSTHSQGTERAPEYSKAGVCTEREKRPCKPQV